MESLAPPLDCCLEVELRIEMGDSVNAALLSWVKNHPTAFAYLVRELLSEFRGAQQLDRVLLKCHSPFRRALFQVLWRGLKGEPILPALKVLRVEMTAACELELQNYYSRLPLVCLVPLLFFIFPAFMILLMGPVLSQLDLGGLS